MRRQTTTYERLWFPHRSSKPHKCGVFLKSTFSMKVKKVSYLYFLMKFEIVMASQWWTVGNGGTRECGTRRGQGRKGHRLEIKRNEVKIGTIEA